ncbi:MAG: DUF1573 domain-containing protein [Prevotellaceae bacterium]|jgi:hypothetical protein|nr:DUF1573 domain-containing protein [Prevotellaceae bacterium]
MKTFYLRTLALLFALSVGANAVNAQENEKQTVGPEIIFDSSTYDFGTITVGDAGEFEITFKNGGTEPLLLQNVHGCCGAKIVSYTKDPVLPEKSGAIKVKIHTGGAGTVSKTITVVSNDSKSSTTRVQFKGTIKALESK